MTIDFRGHTLLAPLTKGGNLPFRRLCVEFGARITMSEMAYARQVVRRSKSELALLRRHPSEACFGVQLAARDPEESVQAAREAVARGAAFVDVNCGCPIHDTTRRGMGATLLTKPNQLARLVAHMVKELPVPVTVKIRTGWSEDEVNAAQVARLVEESGAAALTVHGRTREQRYTKAADWQLIGAIARERTIPVIGNGDILTHYEGRWRMAESGVAALMVGRGALIKPWIFQEIATNQDLAPGAVERVAIYLRFTRFLKEHFREDAKGKERTMRFLPWHLGFFCRYRPLPESEYAALSMQHPLLQTRLPEAEDLSLLERVLRDPREAMHLRLAEELWQAVDEADAVARFERVGEELPPQLGDAGDIAVSTG